MNRTVFWSIAVMVSIGIGVRSYFDDADANTPQLSAAFASEEVTVDSMSARAVGDVGDVDASAPMTLDATATTNEIAATFSQSLIDAKSDDADKRAAAIDRLALAPRSQALPVLQGLLSATDENGRQRVLNVLRTLALEQGDTDGAIREILRLTIYDGDDADVASSALLILDAIELSAADS